jgi:hypothetical protein
MSFDDLNIPEWVQAAWSRPPKKGDILFRSLASEERNVCNLELNAVLRKADGYAYSEGYRLAARDIADRAIQDPMSADFLVYPVIFLYRHYVELQLKRLIPLGAVLVKQDLSKADFELLQKSHRLDHLWVVFEGILQNARQEGIPIGPDEIEGVGWYIREMHDIDPKSYGFRYAVTPSGQASVNHERHPTLNIGVIAKGMERLAGYLFGLGEAFQEAQQLKGEMENDARSEYVEYYDSF